MNNKHSNIFFIPGELVEVLVVVVSFFVVAEVLVGAFVVVSALHADSQAVFFFNTN